MVHAHMTYTIHMTHIVHTQLQFIDANILMYRHPCLHTYTNNSLPSYKCICARDTHAHTKHTEPNSACTHIHTYKHMYSHVHVCMHTCTPLQLVLTLNRAIASISSGQAKNWKGKTHDDGPVVNFKRILLHAEHISHIEEAIE